MTTKIDDSMADAIYAQLMAGDETDDVAKAHSVTQEQVWSICGDHGHEWKNMDNGRDGVYLQAWTACIYCNCPDDGDGEL